MHSKRRCKNVAHALANAVSLARSGKLENPGTGLTEPNPKWSDTRAMIKTRASWASDAKSSRPQKKHFTTYLGQAAAHPAAFGVVILYALAWLAFDRGSFNFKAVATLIVWLMTLLIERSSRRDTLALHAKLDELLRSDDKARSELMTLDEEEPEAIAKHRDAEVTALKRGS
jgi:low affinity Fe/Cu permease